MKFLRINYQDKLALIYFFFLAMIISYISYEVYESFIKNNIPVFDGVMNEKNQINSYLRFKDDFSLKNRYSQVIYEFLGNQLSAGFGCILALIYPKSLSNDIDILLRTFISIYIFCFSVFKLLQKNGFNTNAIFLMISSIFIIPLFYDYRTGITTYVPEISSGLFLFAGFIQLIFFKENNQFKNYIFGLILFALALFSRFNFFVYEIILLLPFTIIIIKKHISTNKLKLFAYSLFSISFFSFYFIYVAQHLAFFQSYYLKPVIYENTSALLSIQHFFSFSKVQLSYLILIFVLLILIFAKFKVDFNYKSTSMLFIYQFSFFSIFFLLYMKASQPHIFALFTLSIVFLVLGVITPKYKEILQNKIFVTIGYSIIFLLLVLNLQNKDKSYKEYKLPNYVSKYVSNKVEKNKDYKILNCFEEQLEVPLFVNVFHKTQVPMNTNLKFYFHDWNYFDIDNKLNFKSISKLYISQITENINLVVIDKKLNKKIKPYKNACYLNRKILSFLSNSNKFRLIKTIRDSYFGEILFFEKISI